MNLSKHDNVHTDLPGKRRVTNLEDEYAKLWQMYGDLEDKYDRLRETLQKIAAMPLSASWQQHFYDAVRLAQDVLQEAGDE